MAKRPGRKKRAKKSETLPSRPLEVLSSRQAVLRAERAICGDAVTREPAQAEGFALVGVRAASLAEGVGAAAGVAVPGTSCVHHAMGAPGCEHAGAFELAATSPQEAVDHCFAAHLLSQGLGRAGLCSLAPALVDRVAALELPGIAMCEPLFAVDADAAEPDAASERIVELAERALRAVAERTARPGDVIRYEGDEPAEVVLVASGACAAQTADVARALSAGGLPTGALAVILVHPFPFQRVRDVLAGARRVFVVEEPGRRGGLLAGVRAVAAEKAAIHPLAPVAPAEMMEAMEAHWPAGAFDEQWRRAGPTPAFPSHRLVVAPAGPWGDETARRIATVLGHLGPLRLGSSLRVEAGAALLDWECEAIPEGGGDLLVAADPSLLDPAGALGLIRPKSTLLLVSVAECSEALAGAIDSRARSAIREQSFRTYWVDDPRLGSRDEDGAADAEARSFHLAGAALAALREHIAARGDDAVDAVAQRLESTGRAAAARALRNGAEAVRSLELEALDPARSAEEVDFRSAPALPRMLALPDRAPDPAEWAQRIRRFHLSGRSFAPGPRLALRPAALGSLRETLRDRSPHPFVLIRRDDATQPVAARALRDLVDEAIGAMQAAGRSARTLADNLPRLVAFAAEVLAEGELAVDLESVLSEATRRLAGELQLPEAEDDELLGDLAALCRWLPDEAGVFDLRSETPLRVTLDVLHAVRAPLQRRFTADLQALCERLRDLLELDRMASEEGRSPSALAAALGGSGAEHLDPAALSRMLPSGVGGADLGDARRRRIRAALAAIGRYVAQDDGLPRAVVVQPPSADPGVSTEEERRVHPDPLGAAVGLFDGVSRRMAELFRAVRTARLEVAGGYLPELHDAALADLDWEAFSAEELDLVPPVVALTTGRRLRQRDQNSLSELLRSSRAVHVVVQDEVGAADEAENLSRFHVDLGYLVIAHREAFALASTLARPVQLVDRLARMARMRRPAVALYHLPALEPAGLRPLLAEAALEGRACPDFCYDPDAGASWADRFDLKGNPEAQRLWPQHAVPYLRSDAEGEAAAEGKLEVALTFADAVALEPAYRRHFQLIPRAAWDDAQLPLADWLEQFDPESRKCSIPFVWMVDDEGLLQRAVVTRELALASGDRMRGWRVVQELAGYGNVFAERAAEATRRRTLTDTEGREQAHAGELERVRRDALRESMQRLAAALVQPEGSFAPVPGGAPAEEAPPVAGAAAPAVTSAEPATAAPPVEEQAALRIEEPYIDSPLCTTCNECTDINSRLFEYNAEKQAFIADASAGSFAQLVKAAELCPARCIHPGKPRSGDASATPELIKRAAAFN